MLSTSHHLLSTVPDPDLYKKTHQNHPCAIWTRKTRGNYEYLLEYFLLALDEYTFRYEKTHKTSGKIDILTRIPDNIDASLEVTELPKCMPDEYKVPSVVESYRNYYREEKKSFATYKKRKVPFWL
jgi:hypothetical protein